MFFKRQIEQQLEKWKANSTSKPLIIRGARQTGKTTSVKKFAQTYHYCILLNLEKDSDISYFENISNITTIVEALFLSNNIPFEAREHTLLFIDEIQESPKAIHLLRYFYEELPELDVIAAGSLLEFVMKKVKSFPVGRVEFLYMHPLNFPEYLHAIGHTTAWEQLEELPVKEFAHPVLLDLFNRYAIVGGMPEIVQRYLGNMNIADLPRVYESVWGTYKEDVEKYASNATERKVIKHIINTAHLYLDQRIKFQNFGNSNYRSREVGEAMRNLDAAKIIRLIYPTTDLEPPMRSNIRKAPRLQFLDTGILNYSLGIQADMLGIRDLSKLYKGAVIPHLITQELISLSTINDKKPNFWVRDKKQASAEVDLLYTCQDKLIPIEIKSGKTGTLKSLHQFVERAGHPYAVRLYAGEFKIEKVKTPGGIPYLLMNMPYYLGTRIPDYIAYFVENHHLEKGKGSDLLLL